MKIAIDCRLIGTTGIGVFIDNVLENILCDKSNSYLLIGDCKTLSCYKSFSNCEIVSCNYKAFSPKELFLFPVKRVNECDAFYTPNFNIPAGIKIPIFSTIHDILFFETENFGSWIHRLALKWYIKRALRMSNSLFTVSEFSRQRIKGYFNSDSELIVVPNGINKALHEYRCDSKGDRKGIVFLGSIKRHKGLHVLLKAYEKLRANNSSCPRLTIIGHVDFRTKDEEILRVIESNKESIDFLGAVSNEVLYDVLSKSEVLVSPSFYEGFGIPPLEAMYLGTPAIISDIPVYKEIYNNLPVTFFKTGDANDLYCKLLDYKYSRVDVKEKIDNMYNYADTAKLILSTIDRKL